MAKIDSTQPNLFDHLPTSKRCRRCGKTKPLEAFPRNKRQDDGLHFNCRPCHTAQTRESILRRKASPRPEPLPDSVKRCRKCGEVKPLCDFSPCTMGALGRNSWCKLCLAAWTKMRREEFKKDPEWLRKYRKHHKDRSLREYGLTPEDYEAMHAKQEGVCAICGKPETAKSRHGTLRRLCVDHCHSTGAVRELLCTNCNTGIGVFREDITVLEKAVAYLRRHQQPS